MLTEKDFQDAARIIGCDVAMVKAVDAVESGGNGFLSDGVTPVILFEPHIFWKELRKVGVDPEPLSKMGRYQDILYPTWGMRPYGKRGQAQHERLQRAASINRPAALKAASWGRFQILGQNYEMCN